MSPNGKEKEDRDEHVRKCSEQREQSTGRLGGKRGAFWLLLGPSLVWVRLRTQDDLRRLWVQEGGNDRGQAPWTPRPLTRLSQAQVQAPAQVLEAAPLPLHPPGSRASIRDQLPPQAPLRAPLPACSSLGPHLVISPRAICFLSSH